MSTSLKPRFQPLIIALKLEVIFCVQGVTSPLLSNLVLNDLDKELERRGHRFCRYADDCVCIFGGSGRTGPSASRNCAVEALRNSLPRLPPVRRRASGACQDTRQFRRHCAIPFSTLSACLASTLRVEAQPGRTAEVRDPYARWCGGAAPRGVPLSRSLALNGNSLSGAEIVSCWGTTAVAATQPSVAQLAT